MKQLIFLFTALLTFTACNEAPKTFDSVAVGMSKHEVITQVGEPTSKNELGLADLWVYRDANRTVIFKKDTVYNIITSADARIDSIKNTLENTGTKIENSINRIGDSIERAGDQIGNKFKKDTTKN